MAGTEVISYFLPIFSFLLVFIVLYAILQKTHVLGDNPSISILISLILSSFFIVETQLVDFVNFTASWMTVIFITIFIFSTVLAFLPGKEPLAFLTKGSWFSWTILVVLVIFFITSATHVFNLAINWAMLRTWAQTEWFGFILLAVIATIISIVLKKSN